MTSDLRKYDLRRGIFVADNYASRPSRRSSLQSLDEDDKVAVSFFLLLNYAFINRIKNIERRPPLCLWIIATHDLLLLLIRQSRGHIMVKVLSFGCKDVVSTSTYNFLGSVRNRHLVDG